MKDAFPDRFDEGMAIQAVQEAKRVTASNKQRLGVQDRARRIAHRVDRGNGAAHAPKPLTHFRGISVAIMQCIRDKEHGLDAAQEVDDRALAMIQKTAAEAG